MGCAGSSPADPTPASAPVAAALAVEDDDVHVGPLSKQELAARVVGSDTAQEFVLGKSGYTLRYAAFSQRGYYPEDPYRANQDRFLALPHFDHKQDQVCCHERGARAVAADSIACCLACMICAAP